METAHAALIRAHLAEGNRSEAVRQFYRCRDLLSAELTVDPVGVDRRFNRISWSIDSMSASRNGVSSAS